MVRDDIFVTVRENTACFTDSESSLVFTVAMKPTALALVRHIQSAGSLNHTSRCNGAAVDAATAIPSMKNINCIVWTSVSMHCVGSVVAC